MRQLDTCDFCGAAADGVYEVVPASVAGDPKRLALCADCRTTLQSVVDPLLAAAESAPADSGTVADSESAADSGTDADSGTVADNGIDADSGTVADSGTDADSGTVADGESDADSGTALDDAINAGDGSDDRGGSSDDDAIDGSDDLNGSADDDTGAAAAPEGRDGSPADHSEGITIEADTEETEGETSENGGSGTEADETSAPEPSRPPRPEGYAQIVRLLQNRDGAMPREDLRVLATNAYDIGGRQFEDAVEAAVANGDVEETGDGLRTV